MKLNKEDELERLQNRVNRLSDSLEKCLLKECEAHNYLAGECYIVLSYMLNRWRSAMGPEAVKQVEKCFQLVDSSSWEEV